MRRSQTPTAMKTPKFANNRPQRGFSLVELLVVITIIVILSGLTIGAMGWVQRKAAVDKAKAQLALLENGLEQYHADTGTYPEGNKSLVVYIALFGDGVGPDGVQGTGDDTSPDGKPDPGARTYLPQLDPNNNSAQMLKLSGTRATGLLDPFGSEWKYMGGAKYKQSMKNPDFDLSSPGPDGKDRSTTEKADDIKNW